MADLWYPNIKEGSSSSSSSNHHPSEPHLYDAAADSLAHRPPLLDVPPPSVTDSNVMSSVASSEGGQVEDAASLGTAASSSPSKPANQPTMFQIFDRRINFGSLPQNASLYSMLRAWVQDDPTRLQPSAIPYGGRARRLPGPAPETAMTLLRLGPKRKGSTAANELNSLRHVPPHTLLDLHVGYMRQVRKGWQKTRARRYQRFKARMTMLGIPPCNQLEKALKEDGASGGGGGGEPGGIISAIGGNVAAVIGGGGGGGWERGPSLRQQQPQIPFYQI